MKNILIRSVKGVQHVNRSLVWLTKAVIFVVLHMVSVMSLLIRLTGLLIISTVNSLLTIFFINPYPKWK